MTKVFRVSRLLGLTAGTLLALALLTGCFAQGLLSDQPPTPAPTIAPPAPNVFVIQQPAPAHVAPAPSPSPTTTTGSDVATLAVVAMFGVAMVMMLGLVGATLLRHRATAQPQPIYVQLSQPAPPPAPVQPQPQAGATYHIYLTSIATRGERLEALTQGGYTLQQARQLLDSGAELPQLTDGGQR